jgi:hypothetical protein
VSTPPLFSTFSAVTEILVSVAVYWFFWRGMRFGDYRWGLITVAIVYETLFNITYMVSRVFTHEEGVTHDHPAWVTAFVAVHGSLSLLMFLGLIGYVLWVRRRHTLGMANPLAQRRRFSQAFLVLWTLSVVSGELIFAMYFTGTIS